MNASTSVREGVTVAPRPSRLEDANADAAIDVACVEATRRVDYATFRLELLKLIKAEFGEQAKRKNRIFIPFLLDFHEYVYCLCTPSVNL